MGAERALSAVRARVSRLPGVAVACSGGADSMVLATLASGVAPTRLLHVNHHLRADSWRDEAAVRALAARLAIDVAVAHLDPRSLSGGLGLEAAARQARYRALAALLRPGEVVLTAHSADDQLETLAMRMGAGCGVRGLPGIRARAVIEGAAVVRPMLDLWRCEVDELVEAHGLEPVDDAMNRDERFDRVAIRQRVVRPWLELAPRAGLGRSLRLLRAEAQTRRELVAALCRSAAAGSGLDRVALAAMPSRVRREVLAHWLSGASAARVPGALLATLSRRVGGPGPFVIDGTGFRVAADRDSLQLTSQPARSVAGEPGGT